MEIAVKYVHIPGSGVKPALCFRGRKFARCIVNDGRSIRVREVSLKEFDQARLVPHGSGPYPVELFINHMDRIGLSQKPITVAARLLMAKANSSLTDDDLPAEDSEDKGSEPDNSRPVKREKAEAKPNAGPSGSQLIAVIAAAR